MAATPLLFVLGAHPALMVAVLTLLDLLDCALVAVFSGDYRRGLCSNSQSYHVKDKALDVVQYAAALAAVSFSTQGRAALAAQWILPLLWLLLAWRTIGVALFIERGGVDRHYFVPFFDAIKEVLLVAVVMPLTLGLPASVSLVALVILAKLAFEVWKNGSFFLQRIEPVK